MRAASFIVVFVFGFFFGGWFLRPHLPPVPDHPVNVLDLEFWEGHGAGAILGLALATASSRSAAWRTQSHDPVFTPLNTDRIKPS